jgi:Flp pilus assembly protein TadB
VILLRALIAVIHAVLQTAASALVAGFSLLIVVLIALLVLAALIATVAGGLGMGSIHWLRRRSRDRRNSNSRNDPPCP